MGKHKAKPLELKDNPEEGVCRIKGCSREDIYSRGLCNKCYLKVCRSGELEVFGAPRKIPLKPQFKIKKNPKKDICRIRSCSQKSSKFIHRGMCKNHFTEIRDLKKLNVYALPRDAEILGLKENPVDGICRIEKCQKSSKTRGLCGKHYTKLYGEGKLEAFALPSVKRGPKEAAYQIKENPEEGVCRFEGCSEATRSRGLCNSHYVMVHKKGKLDEYGTSPQEVKLMAKAKALEKAKDKLAKAQMEFDRQVSLMGED